MQSIVDAQQTIDSEKKAYGALQVTLVDRSSELVAVKKELDTLTTKLSSKRETVCGFIAKLYCTLLAVPD